MESLKKNSLKTIQNYHTINFPVYKIPSEPEEKDGLVFTEGRLIDDINIKNINLGYRRLRSPHKMSALTAYRESIVDLIKDSKSTEEWYIDSHGKPIKYRKTTTARLICHKIKKVMYKNTYSMILVNNVNFPIIVNKPPTGSYAQMLYFAGHPWKLYDTLYEPHTTYKKV